MRGCVWQGHLLGRRSCRVRGWSLCMPNQSGTVVYKLSAQTRSDYVHEMAEQRQRSNLSTFKRRVKMAAFTTTRPPPRCNSLDDWCFAMALQVIACLSVSGSHLGVLHQIPEGHVGVYWRGGALLRQTSSPGFHFMLPFVTRVDPIQVTIQTDEVRNIPCGTKGGVMIYFDKIEVVNRLNKDYVHETILNYGVTYDKIWIYDKIHHEINQFCSSHSLQEVYIDMFDQIDEKVKEAIQRDCTLYAQGLEIISVRVTKPTIPESIARNYQTMEEERTKVLIAIEKQKVIEKEAETAKKRAVTEAEQAAQVSKILMEQRLMEKESIKRQQFIENEIYTSTQKSLADSDFYRVLKEAEVNKLKLTPQFLELKFFESIANNTKIFFGEKIPSMVCNQRLLGSYFKSPGSD